VESNGAKVGGLV